MHTLRYHLRICFQDLFASPFLHMLVYEIIAEGLSLYERQFSAFECNNCVIKALHEVYLNSSIYINLHVFFLWTEIIDYSYTCNNPKRHFMKRDE
ncbi:hypothetical protein BM1374166_00239 [Bartonella tribocorum]|nr:hypothetical protein BM1374166_00239 [Bartonella tribocorum]